MATVHVNGREVARAILVGGRAVAEVRLIAEALGAEVGFDEALQAVQLTLPAPAAPPGLPFVLPVKGNWPITNPFSAAGGYSNPWGDFHLGLDLGCPEGTPVLAVAAGAVILTGEDGVVGRYVLLGHPDGTRTEYLHLSQIQVTRGQLVTTGQQIGLAGSTGWVKPKGPAGAHLHFGIWVGCTGMAWDIYQATRHDPTGLPVDPEQTLWAGRWPSRADGVARPAKR